LLDPVAPAQDALEYKLTSYASSIYGGETPYQGPPTAENNALWKNLYSRKCFQYSAWPSG